MTEKRPVLLLASAAALTLALNQGAVAEATTSDPAASAEATAQSGAVQAAPATEAVVPAPVAEVPAAAGATPETGAPPPGIAAGRERMEERQAEIMAQRRHRYEELRARAAEVGLALPETPPWEQTGLQPPEMPFPPQMPAAPEMPAPPDMAAPPQMPGMPAPMARDTVGPSDMTTEGREAMLEQRHRAMRERAMQHGIELPETPPGKLMSEEERQAHWEMMRNMSPEQYQAMRDAHWEQMRRRAQEQGMQMPELPPWKQTEERREEMQARWEKYREIVDQMSQEQREAAEAIFGARAQRRQPAPPMNPPMQPPYGGNYGMPQRPTMPGYGQGADPYMYRGGPTDPWYGGDEGMGQGPPPPDAGYNRTW